MNIPSLSVVRTVIGLSVLTLGCAWGRSGDDGRTLRSARGGITLGGHIEKKCIRCGHAVAPTAKAGQHCPYCGILWSTESDSQGRAQAISIRTAPVVTATVRPIGTTVSARIRELDATINAQNAGGLSEILAVNFVLLGRDGRVQLDGDRYLETAITDAVATSLSRRTTVIGTRSDDGEFIVTVKVYSKRYPPDAKPEYTTSYEQETWTTEGLAPRLRLIKPIPTPRPRR